MAYIDLSSLDKSFIKLRDFYDTLGFGYAPTVNGYEFHMLLDNFTKEDAERFVLMDRENFFLAEDYAPLIGASADEAETICFDMSKRGLIFRANRGGRNYYRVMPFVHGIHEFTVNKVSAERVVAMFKHFADGYNPYMFNAGIPFYRVMPASTAVIEEGNLLPDHDVFELVSSKRRWAVTPCLCVLQNKAIDRTCRHSSYVDRCLTTDEMADFYIENGIGRDISLDEALRILEKDVEEGLVLQMSNSKDCEVVCACATCCCGMLRSAKLFPGSASENISNYLVAIDAGKCSSCQTCIEVCPMGALKSDGDLPWLDGQCVGCGQCALKCPSGAMSLRLKKPEQPIPYPDTLYDAYVIMQRYREDGELIGSDSDA